MVVLVIVIRMIIMMLNRGMIVVFCECRNLWNIFFILCSGL